MCLVHGTVVGSTVTVCRVEGRPQYNATAGRGRGLVLVDHPAVPGVLGDLLRVELKDVGAERLICGGRCTLASRLQLRRLLRGLGYLYPVEERERL